MTMGKTMAQWGLRPEKRLGQNFLVEPSVAARIADAAELTHDDTVLEIGPGLGALTVPLSARAGRVVAVELDRRLLGPLDEVLTGIANVTVVQGDILKLRPAELLGPGSGRYVLVGNLPYYITSAILRHVMESAPRPERIVVTVQREVADRIVARPGDMSLLAVSVQCFGTPRVLFNIKPGSFSPRPDVTSSVLRVDVSPTPTVAIADSEVFFRIVRAGFSQRRKQLRNSLAAGLAKTPAEATGLLQDAGVDERRRAQTLSLDEWADIARAYADRTV
jgi:16S rRNA (adenine1518-N6/adenine1519-N6)-dimethyltransferase